MFKITAPFFLLVFFSILAPVSCSQADSTDKIIISPSYSPSQIFPSDFEDGLKPGIGLVLSGGGARGLAHIGVLKVLESENIDIRIIAGVSMGGVVGGLYSAGYRPEEIEQIALRVNWLELFSPNPLRGSLLATQKGLPEKSLITIRFSDWRPVIPGAITSGQNLSQFLEKLATRAGIRSSVSFDYLDPPIRIVCTDLSTGEEVVISSGNLAEAMRATLAAPVAFTPVDIGGRFLVDGGLVDPIPISVLENVKEFPIVAVNTTSELVPATGDENVIEMADQTTNIMSMKKKTESLEKADLAVVPNLKGITSTDFSDVASIISAGEEAALSVMPRLNELLDRFKLSNNGELYRPVIGWEISGLEVLPKTMFKVLFTDSTIMLTSDIRANLNAAMSSGFLEDARAEIVCVDSGYFIDYILNDCSRIKKISVEGAILFPENRILDLIESRPGMTLNRRMLKSDTKRIESLYIDSGFNLVRVSAEFNRESGHLRLLVDEGKIKSLIIEGNDFTRDWMIKRHVPFDVGDVYKGDRAEQGVSDLYGTGLFETARFLAIPDSEGVSLIVRVNEKPSKMIRTAARYDNEYGAKALFDIVDDNVFGAGQQFFLSTTVGEKRRSVSINFKADRIFKTYFTYKLEFDYEEFKRNHYIDHQYEGYNAQYRHGGELSIGRQISRLGTFSVVGKIRRYRWDEPSVEGRQTFDKGSVGFRSIVDTRDNISFPESGKYHIFELDFAGELTGEKIAYTRFHTSLESYYRITGNMNFHPRISLGLSSNFMPYFDEFILGGYQNFIGLYQDEVLGDKLFSGELAFRYNLPGPFYLHLKYDMGNIWNKLQYIRFSELRYSAGAGVSLKSPLGPISVWYGRTSRGLDAVYFYAGYDW
ncbi:MAG: BamA/TamA family outer membrane protein [Candidatus Zixiibacteriota bacterium]|nr:MAG: BamA/TamA family outer membrane protein [candidate division Zixibacteria bacterium]